MVCVVIESMESLINNSANSVKVHLLCIFSSSYKASFMGT